MKKVIWKYRLEVTDYQDLEIPEGSEILSVQVQNGVPCLWVLVHNTEAETVTTKLTTVGTGNPISDDIGKSEFIGTYQIPTYGFIGHLFLMN